MTARSPLLLPKNFRLANGSVINSIGFGLWKVPREQTAETVSNALDLGYRHVDGAFAYGNEDIVGEVLEKKGIDRKHLWLTSKTWNSFWDPTMVKASAEDSLKKLKTPYMDLLLLHWPVAFSNPEKKLDKMPVKRDGKQLPVIDREAMENLQHTWEALENLVKEGKVRQIGVSNFSIGKTKNLLGFAKEKPVVNQVEINLHCSQPDLVKFNQENDILTQAYSPLGSDAKQASYSKEPLIVELSNKLNVSPTQLILAWHLKRGINPLPRSTNKQHLQENLEAMNIQFPQDVFDALQEAYKTPTNRIVDPSASWGVDIFSDEV
ncbi:Aldo/keto reductase [Wallemia mellicola]|uniref:Aldo/keto reductase n=1 Tax=Wallemia mellicola TaxID=1708541 RepID=A0A4T0R6W5_9BASI|nr:Aldo/keto reductase [Wallemia mellicola]